MGSSICTFFDEFNADLERYNLRIVCGNVSLAKCDKESVKLD